MFKKLLNKKMLKNEKGLTLIELLAVIVILAIVAAIAIPAIGNIVNNSRDKAIISDALNIIAGAKIAKMDGVCDDTCEKTDLAGYVEGINDDYDYSAEYTDADGWKVDYDKFGEMKTGKYTVEDGTPENELKLVLEKGNE